MNFSTKLPLPSRARAKMLSRRTGRFTTAYRLALLAITALPLTALFAFKPFNNSLIPYSSPPAGNESHESMTRQAMRDFVTGDLMLTVSATAEGSFESIVSANGNVDRFNAFDADSHFDSETFAGGQKKINDLLKQVATDLDPATLNLGSARSSLGQAFHTLQDFYSHSNWVELGTGSFHSDLAVSGKTISHAAAVADATCVDCMPASADCSTPYSPNVSAMQLVTSGYFVAADFFGGLTAAPKPAGKCSHGGANDRTKLTPPLGGINKDSTDAAESPHGNNMIPFRGASMAAHFAAGVLAREHTRAVLNSLRAQLAAQSGSTPARVNQQLRALLHLGPTLAICIDTTGSMGDIIQALKDNIVTYVNSRIGTPDEPSIYILKPYNDPDTEKAFVTLDAQLFKNKLLSLGASGGGDCPEPSGQAMAAALAAADPYGELFLLTDADASDPGKMASVTADAVTKHIKIIAGVYGSCTHNPSASRPGETPESPTATAPTHGVDPVYYDIARDSGGQVFSLEQSDIPNFPKLASLTTGAKVVDIFSISDTLTGSARNYTLPLDDTLTSATFRISGASSITVTRPNGTPVQSSDAGVTSVPLTNGAAFKIASPGIGNWRINVNGTGPFTIRVSGESPLFLRSFKFLQPGGRGGHEGLYPIDGFPISGSSTSAQGDLSDGFATAQFELRSLAGAPLQTLNLTRRTGVAANQFNGEVTPPAGAFLVYVTGQDTAGVAYQRVLASPFSVQSVGVTAPPPQELQAAQMTSYVFQIKNFGGSDTFTITAADDQGYLTNVDAPSFTLGTGETKNVTAQLQPPANAAPGTSDTLTLNVRGNSGAKNFAVVVSRVTALPVIKTQPQSQIANAGTNVTFSVVASGNGLTYQWQLNGTNISGQTGSTLTLTNVTANQAGAYSVVVTNSGGSVTSSSAILTITSGLQAIQNISTRAGVGTGEYVLIGGFIIQGNDPKRVMVRAIGPSLINFGLTEALADPTLELHGASGNTIAVNDDWSTGSQAQAISDSMLAPADTRESALIAVLNPGNYTAIVQGFNNTLGIAVCEVYDLDQGVNSRLANIATRGYVGTGSYAMIGGFIVGAKGTFVIRGIGPSLFSFGVNNPLSDPVLSLYDSQGTLFDTNDDWQDNPFAELVLNSGLAPSNGLESALIYQYFPGNYTAIVRGYNDQIGVALVEIYHLP